MRNLDNIQRNRMLGQRESFWRSERTTASRAIDLLNSDFGYRSAMNVFANFISMNILLWGNECDRITRKQVSRALSNENGLGIWRDSPATLDSVLSWIARGRKWDVEGASELFRLFVAVVEEVEKEVEKEVATATGLKMIKITSTNYQFSDQEKARYSSHYELEALSVDSFKRFSKDMASIKNRTLNGVKLFTKTGANGPIDPDKPRSRWSLADAYERIIDLKNDDVNSKRRMARMLTNSSGGTNIHSLKPNSLIGTIEWIYGLASGADTSGTTAEILALCKLFENYLPKQEIDDMTSGVSWYLGPVLAMIKNGHHTMIESAIAITMGERTEEENTYQWPVKYVPGFYQTMMMPAPENYPERTLYQQVFDELKALAMQDNFQMFLYRPTENAWGASEEYNVSLAGGTIINNYNYVMRTGEEIRKLELPLLLDRITAYIAERGKGQSTLTQVEAIYTMVKNLTRTE
jgi:hypothetical protein